MKQLMKRSVFMLVAGLALPGITMAQAQERWSATYVTLEEWESVNALPGVDRQLVSRDIGALNLSVGIIHRGATGGGGGGGRGAGNPETATCGVRSTEAPPEPVVRGIAHDHQTETYLIVSGSGVLVTGGYILNGSQSSPTSSVTTTLNGPSCSGVISGDDQVRRFVKEGDIVIIPATTPHGWESIEDHVDYLSVRPDPDRVLPDDYFHPSLNRVQ